MIVHGGGERDVRHVFVDGRMVVRDGELATADGAAIRRAARAAAASLERRLGWA